MLLATAPISHGDKLVGMEGVVVGLRPDEKTFGSVNGYVISILHNILI